MLILLEQDVVDGLASASDADIACLDDLLFYHSKSYHYVAASKRNALKMAEILGSRLSARGVQTLKAISTQSNDLANLLRGMRVYAAVRQSELAGCIVEQNHGKTIWVCSLQYAAKWFSQPATVIGEHLTDTKIFKASARNYATNNSLDSKMQRFKSEMSGGSGNAPTVMENRIADGAGPVLCVLDSDKLSMDSDPSDSVKKCHAVVEKMGGVSHFVSLDERELENLIPHSLLKAGVMSLPVSSDRDIILQRLDELETLRQSKPEIYSFVDVKEGTCRKWAAKHNVAPFFAPAPVVAPCSCHKECDGLIAQPIFKEVLNRASDFTEKQSPKQLHDALKSEQWPSWVKLGQTIFSFSLSNNIRTT